jgi:TRAP-type mannitol/chloroaromatic compound transport system permease small subunit
MNAVKSRIGALREMSLPVEFLPVLMVANVYYSVTERARTARQDGERGAVSIEQAIITIAVVAFALVILAAIALLVKNVTAGIDTAPTVPKG